MTGVVVDDPRSDPLDLSLVPLLENLAQASPIHIRRHVAFATAQVMKGGKKVPLHDGHVAL